MISDPSRLLRYVLLLLVPYGLGTARAGEITISLVAQEDGELVPLEPYNELRRSPYGGWVTVMWPFSMKIGDTPILGYKSELLEQAWAMQEEGEATKELESDETFMKELGIEGPAVVPGIRRESSAKVTVGEGERLLVPGGIPITLHQGKLSSNDARAKIKVAEDLVEVVCWPVTFRAFDQFRSVAAPMVVSYEGTDLVKGVLKPLEDPEKRKRPQSDEQTQGLDRFRRIVMYLPPSTGGKPYQLNGVPFTVDLQGKVSLTDSRYVELVGQAELRLKVPSGPPTHIVGKRFVGDGFAHTLAEHPYVPACPKDSSMESIATPHNETSVSVSFDMGRSHAHAVSVPNTFYDLPYKTVLFDSRSGVSYVFETGQFLLRPGGNYACHFRPVGGREKPGPELALRFVPLYQERSSVAVELTGKGDGVFHGDLPAEIGQGLWLVTVGHRGPLEGQSLGLVTVAQEQNPATVSLYTYRNRAGFLRGDFVDLYSTVRTPEGATPVGDFELVLHGSHLEKVIAAGTGDASPVATGHIRLDTSTLAPGPYVVTVRPASVVCYPTHFFVYQREPLSDYGINSYAPFGETGMEAGGPINAFYARGTGADEPGLASATDRARSGLDVAFAAYSTHPAGPAPEKFFRPNEDEIGLMTLARAGKKAILHMPVMLHHEDWNPKHTLPEELTRLRRRNALFTQKYADVPGFTGINLNWYATLHGYWEEVERLDGNQARRNAAAGKWVSQRIAEWVEAEKAQNPDPKHLETIRKQGGTEFWSRVLPTAYEQYLADAKVIKPGLTSHTGIPTFWFGGGASYTPNAYSTLSHRDSVDYTDYCRPPWSNFRGPAFLDMNNPQRQKTQMCTAAAGRHARFIVSFGAAGRGLDGFAFPNDRQPVMGDHDALLRIFERFGSYFTALDPLPDVAVYFSKATGWGRQKNVILHDLARVRRPGVLLAEEDVLRGDLEKYKVLFLAAVGEHEIQTVRDAFTKFAERGGTIIKDQTVSKSYPGIDLGFAYDKGQLHNGWGLAYPNGEWEFAHLWTNFLAHREKPLLEAFREAPSIPVTTSDREIVISPLAGKESICCFVINVTYVPMSVEGKWRQHAALARKGDLIVEKGWHVHDLLRGVPCEVAEKDGKSVVEMDFSRAEGRIYLLTKRKPESMAMRTRRGPAELLLDAWLEDAEGKALPDPMPFEVTLTGPDGRALFHKYAAVGPDSGLAIPLPEMNREVDLKLTVRDLVLGSFAVQSVKPLAAAAPPGGKGFGAADTIGAAQIPTFLHEREKRVIVLLDEGQDRYQGAAEAMVALLKKNGREAKVMALDAAEVREQPLRWHWTDEDQKLLAKVSAGEMVAWRVGLAPYDRDFTEPLCGYDEYGPRTWIDGDVVLFGGPRDNRALDDLSEFLRRRPSMNYPSPGRFFLHYVWDPFLGKCDGLYIGCNDPAGAEAAVRHLASVAAPPGGTSFRAPALSQSKGSKGEMPKRSSTGASDTVVTKGGPLAALEDMLHDKLGTKILDVAYAPSGKKIFLSVDSYGDCFFVLDPEGKVISSRPVGNRFWNNIWWSGSGTLRPLSDDELYLGMGGNDFLFSLTKGFLNKTASPPHGLPGRVRVTPGGPVLYRDFDRQRTYIGGKVQLVAIAKDGSARWRYHDADYRTGTNDMLHRRSIFIRGISPNGKRMLLTAFGVAQDVYGIGSPQNVSVFCVDTDSGKMLWARNGLYLNEGKAILTDDRFVIVDDEGQFHLLNADTGEPVGKFRSVGGTDVIRPVPETDRILVVENNQFDLSGATNLTYLRAPGDKDDIILDLPGRLKNAVLTPDGKRVILSSRRGQTGCFALDGRKLWSVAVPAGGVVRFSPDGRTTLVGSETGRLFFIGTETGRAIRSIDFNHYNRTSPEQFVKQLGNVGEVPVEKAARVPPAPPERSYLDSLDKDAVRFGPNLIGKDVLLGKLEPGTPSADDPAQPKFAGLLQGRAEFQLKVEPKSTYLVEFLNASTDPAQLTPQTRTEVTVSGVGSSKHLPFTGRLPIDTLLTRRRMAFRTGTETQVTLSMRVVVPTKTGEGRRAQLSYAPGETSEMPMLIADTVVAAVKFRSGNFLKGDEGQLEVLSSGQTGQQRRGWIECTFHRWSGGSSLFKKWTWKAPQRALGMCDGLIGNQETKWQEARDAVTGTSIRIATADIVFKEPETITALAVYEDNRGPALRGNAVQEMTTAHYGIYIDRQRVGYAVNNTNLINIFTFPSVKTKAINYVWAGREFTWMTDGMIRTAEIEVYSTEEADLGLDEAGDVEKGEGLEGDLKLESLE